MIRFSPALAARYRRSPVRHQTASPILVLGAQGFLGRHVVDGLDRDEGFDAIRHVRTMTGVAGGGAYALDLTSASTQAIRHLIDVTEASAVINCVGRTSGDASSMYVANVAIVERLIDALARRPAVRLVHVGSAAEYGPSQPGVAMTEDTEARPSGPYGSMKLKASQLVRVAAEEGRVDAVVLRVFNPIGARAPATTLAGRLAGELRAASLDGRRQVHVSSLATHRDFVDARDVADAAIAAAHHHAAPASVFNVARGEAVSCRDLVAMLVAISGYRGEVIEDADPPGRSAAVSWQQADIGAIRSKIGWSPRYSLNEAIEQVWANARLTGATVSHV